MWLLLTIKKEVKPFPDTVGIAETTVNLQQNKLPTPSQMIWKGLSHALRLLDFLFSLPLLQKTQDDFIYILKDFLSWCILGGSVNSCLSGFLKSNPEAAFGSPEGWVREGKEPFDGCEACNVSSAQFPVPKVAFIAEASELIWTGNLPSWP